MKCCERDNDGDGNCSIHSAPGVLRERAGGPRPVVLTFAQVMETKLRKSDSKGGWKDCNAVYLVKRLKQELQELEEALAVGSSQEIAREAADVANFAMMIADNCGGLR